MKKNRITFRKFDIQIFMHITHKKNHRKIWTKQRWSHSNVKSTIIDETNQQIDYCIFTLKNDVSVSQKQKLHRCCKKFITKQNISRQTSFLIASKIEYIDFSWFQMWNYTYWIVCNVFNESWSHVKFFYILFKRINFMIYSISISSIDLIFSSTNTKIFLIWLIISLKHYSRIQHSIFSLLTWNRLLIIIRIMNILCLQRCIETQTRHSNRWKWKICLMIVTLFVYLFQISFTNSSIWLNETIKYSNMLWTK